MDSHEATKVVFSRIQSLDPENASKIMGYLLLQDHGDKEMIRLVFGSETLLHNLILKAKIQLGLISSNSPSTPSAPSSPSPFNPTARPSPLSVSSSRIPSNNGFDITNPSSPSSSSWPLLSPNSTSSLSYASIVNGTSSISTGSTSLPSTASLSNAFPYHNKGVNINEGNNLIDEYQLQEQEQELQEQFSFFNDSKTDDLFDPRLDLKRSFSVPGMCFGSEDTSSGIGWKPCLYFARGFCKNGTSCRFLHGESSDGAAIVGSPSKLNDFDQYQELLRTKAAAQQQKLAAAPQFMDGTSFPYDKCMNFLLQQQNGTQRSAVAAALMMGDDFQRFGRCRLERNDFSLVGLGGPSSSSSRQIYLTFPADSTFREEDVSNYFSIYGPVHDVRIPYQQKRMFGFVTFVYPETVKLILAKGNPHFVCDSRVLVKPYKEKGKVPDKKQHNQQQMERGEYLACSSPESFDHHLGARMFYNTQEVILRKKLEEQTDLQQAIELHGRRLMNLQLLDVKNNSQLHQHHHFHGLSSATQIHSPTLPHNLSNRIRIPSPGGTEMETLEETGKNPDAAVSGHAVADSAQEVNPASNHNNGKSNDSNNEEKSSIEESDLHESLEHILPDHLFSSPKESTGNHLTVFNSASVDVDNKSPSPTTSSFKDNALMPTTGLNVTSVKSCFPQMPRFSSGHETIGM